MGSDQTMDRLFLLSKELWTHHKSSVLVMVSKVLNFLSSLLIKFFFQAVAEYFIVIGAAHSSVQGKQGYIMIWSIIM